MKSLKSKIHRMINVGAWIGCFALLGSMVLTVANIMYRLSGRVIVGTYEMSELLIVVFVGFALSYAGLTKTHASVTILLSRLPRRWKLSFERLVSVLGFFFCSLVAWASAELAFENSRIGEKTDMLGIPYAPFRWIFVFGLALLSVVILLNFTRREKEK